MEITCTSGFFNDAKMQDAVMHQEICYENLHSRFPLSNLIGSSVVKDFCIVVTDFCTVVTDFCTPLRD